MMLFENPTNQLILRFTRLFCSGTVLSKRLNNKVAIVTASTDGVGFAIAKRLAEEGAKVVVSSRQEANVASAVGKLKKLNLDVLGVKCHVANPEDRKRLFRQTIKQYGGLDILVSNAATNPVAGPVIDCEEHIWDKVFDVNVKSSFMLTKEAIPLLRERKGASIVYISSAIGFEPCSLLGVYSVTKTALFGLTKAVSRDLAPDGIRVNCVAPGLIKTKFSAPLYDSKTLCEAALDMIPLHRIGNPYEIGTIVAFLVSDDASYITGETIVAAGGAMGRL